MPRSTSDATRFTATGPYISSNPPNTTIRPSNPSQINSAIPASKNETPQQKIARLRAAAAASKRGKESQFDRVVLVGRRWADRAHRVTTISLIGLTAVSAAVAVAGISDMIIHNRRRRNEWLQEQQAKSARALAGAKAALAAGDALTEEQKLLINRDQIAMATEAAKNARPGVLQRVKTRFLGDSTNGEPERVLLEPEAAPVTGTNIDNIPTANEYMSAPQQNLMDSRITSMRGNSLTPSPGGPLDQQAQLIADSVSQSSWNLFARWRGN